MLLKRLSPDRRNDAGSALIGVLALMTVTAIIGVTVATSAISGLSATSSARASVQARAAAEAGVDVAVVGLQNVGSCEAALGIYESALAPRYRAEIQYNDSGVWIDGCPPATATQVRIESTGFAEARGVAGASSGDSRVIEAVYNYIPDYVEIPDIDAAVYAHTMQGSLKNFTLDSVNASLSADLQIKSGNVNCTNGARIAGDVILADGSATLTNCDVSGSIHVSRNVTVQGSRVYGDIVAAGVGTATGTDVVTVRGAGTVDGNIYSGGNASILSSSASLAKANVTVAGTTSSKATIASGSTVQGNVISSGTVNAQGSVGGSVSSAVQGLQSPPVPRIPDWTDVPYPSATWAANGYSEILWTGACTVGSDHEMWTTLSARTTPTVVNALSCSAAAGGLTIDSNVSPLTLQTNVAFIAPRFYFNKLKLVSPANRSLFLIQPDNTADGVPTCPTPAQGGITLTNESDIPSTVSVMAYTPCKIYSNRDGWRGQMYGGEVGFGQQAKLTFAPVGIPGVDFSGGVPPTVVLDGGHLGNRVSVRELGSGG